MTVLQIEHKVSSYEGWKKAFDNDPINRKKSGVTHYQIYRPAEDPNYVVVDLYFSNLENAQATLNVLQNLWSKVQGTVMVNPKARILDVVETVEV